MPDDAIDDPRQIIADLQRERDEALAREAAIAEVLGVINSSPGDLAPVFDALLEKATRLCEPAFGALLTWNGERFQRVAWRGISSELIETTRQPMAPPPPGAPGYRIAHGESVVAIADLVEEAASGRSPAIQTLGRFGGRSYVAVALRKDDKLLGMIAIFRREVRPFSEKEIALLQNFAAQAVIAMENARLITETREALEQQTATAEVLGVINSSPGNLGPVFDAILEKAHILCGAVQGAMYLCDGDHFYAVAQRGHDEPFAARLRQGFRGSETPTSRPLISGDRFVHIPDLGQLEHPIMRAGVELAGTRTLLSVPLRKGDALLGMVVAARREARPFSEKEIALLENFAAQAVIAMENARLIGELRQRTTDLEEALEYQTATSDVLKVISGSTLDLQRVLDTLVETAARICQADHSVMFRLEDGLHRVAACHGGDPDYIKYLKSAPFVRDRGTLSGRTALEGHVVQIEDAATDPEYNQPEFQRRGNLRTGLGVPLMRDAVEIGVLVLYRFHVEPFTQKQIDLATTFADQAVIAIENARLLSELRGRTEEVAELNRGLEARVAEQVAELERTGKLRRFLAPQLADLIVAHGDESILESHRREIVVVFCDLRGFTAFAERAEAEEVMELLRDYHAAMGPIVAKFEGTVDHYSGDGIMVFFNDPLPTAEPAKRAIDMAVAMREAAQPLLRLWRRQGHDLGFGVGIAQGYATLGQIGFAERMDYTAIGTVTNLAARLCAEAQDGQILVARRAAVAVEDTVKLEEVGDLALKGLSQAVAVYNVPAVGSPASARDGG